MTTRVHEDETAPRKERYRVLREDTRVADRWITVESFATKKEAHAFAQGFTLGSQYGEAAATKPLTSESDAMRLVKLARDDYKRECRELREQLDAHR